MNILSIETSSDICSVAVIIDGKCAHIIEKSIPRQHAEKLPVFYAKLMEGYNYRLKDIDAIAISIGPGSFTGLRIGLSYAKGLAYSHSLPIIPVPTLSSLFFGSGSRTEKNLIIISSHRDFYYFQKISGIEGVSAKSDIKSAELFSIDDIDDSKTKFIIQYGSEKLFDNSELKYQTVVPSAKWVGELAFLKRSEWINNEPYKLVPQYISPFKTN